MLAHLAYLVHKSGRKTRTIYCFLRNVIDCLLGLAFYKTVNHALGAFNRVVYYNILLVPGISHTSSTYSVISDENYAS